MGLLQKLNQLTPVKNLEQDLAHSKYYVINLINFEIVTLICPQLLSKVNTVAVITI